MGSNPSPFSQRTRSGEADLTLICAALSYTTVGPSAEVDVDVGMKDEAWHLKPPRVASLSIHVPG
jgi:hypothetical protein